MTSEVIRFAPGLKPVLKHQQGGHDQKTHGRRAGAGDDRPALRFDDPDYEPFDLPSGWTERSYSDIQAEVERRLNRSAEERGTPDPEYARELSAEIASYTFEYDGGNGTRVSVYSNGFTPDAETMTTMLRRIDTLQEDFPVQDLRVRFDNGPFVAENIEDSAGAFVRQGSKTINLRPAYSQQIDGVMPEVPRVLRDQYMPSRQTVTEGEYVLAHEWGHVMDRRSLREISFDMYGGEGKKHVFADLIEQANLDFQRSEYSNSNESENYAEAFAEYALTGGTTDIGYVQAYAETYDWGRNLEKAVDDLGDDGDTVIFVDTFTMNPPPYIIVRPKPAVVKFAPGLRPVLKHQQGSHDQKTHGAWATGGAGGDFSEWGSRAAQIREIAEVAPPLAELERLLANPEDAISLRMDDLIADVVLERQSLIEESTAEELDAMTRGDGFIRDEFQAWLVESGGPPAFDSQEEAATAFRDFMRPRATFESVAGNLNYDRARLRSEAQEIVQKEMIDALSPGMQAVFGIEHPVTLPDGSSDLMEVSVRNVNWNGGLSSERPTVQVVMDVYNSDGNLISEGVQRAFRLGTDGKLEVENVYLKIDDDAYKGKGFATVFNERAYDAYISQGVESVTVGTAWDGGFVWANKGFAWDESAPFKNARAAEDALQRVLRDSKASAPTLERAATMLSDVQEQVSRAQPDVSKMPTPMEIAMLGYRDQGTGAFGSVETTVWPGKSALYDIRWKGRKELTPENLGGIARSKADMRRPQEIPGQQPLFDKNPVVQQPSTPATTEEIMELLRPIGKATQLSYWEKIEQQAEFYEKWIMETGRGLEEEDPDSMDDFFAAAVEAMPWLVE